MRKSRIGRGHISIIFSLHLLLDLHNASGIFDLSATRTFFLSLRTFSPRFKEFFSVTLVVFFGAPVSPFNAAYFLKRESSKLFLFLRFQRGTKGHFHPRARSQRKTFLAKVTRKVIREQKGSVTKLNALQQCFFVAKPGLNMFLPRAYIYNYFS